MVKLKRKHEQSLIDAFAGHFRRQAEKIGRMVTKCSFDGQDVVLGSDYLFTDNSRFMMVEFKYEQPDLASEGRKPRRRKMCLCLDKDQIMARQSVKCHYIAWSVANGKRHIELNAYYHQICNKEIFGEDSGMARDFPVETASEKADTLIQKFFDRQAGDDFLEFKRYCEWLTALEGGSDSIELLLDNPDKDQLELLEFGSLAELKTWLDLQTFKPRDPGLGM